MGQLHDNSYSGRYIVGGSLVVLTGIKYCIHIIIMLCYTTLIAQLSICQEVYQEVILYCLCGIID